MDRYDSENDKTNRGNGGSLLAGLVIGSIVGAGTMLLLAPQSGRRTREELQEGAMQMRDRATESVRGAVTDAKMRANQMKAQVREKADELQEQGRDMLAEKLDQVSSAAQAGKKAVQGSRSNTSSS